MKKKVLFICIHNSARSQMAEAFLNKLGADKYFAQSAGIEPGKLNPLVVEAMREIGIDIGNNKTKTVEGFLPESNTFDYIITVCDETSAERCPVFPGKSQRIHWSFRDPSAFTGTYEVKMNAIREVRDEIKSKVELFVKQ